MHPGYRTVSPDVPTTACRQPRWGDAKHEESSTDNRGAHAVAGIFNGGR